MPADVLMIATLPARMLLWMGDLSAEDLRARAALLRETARKIRQCSGQLTADLHTLRTRYMFSETGIWNGPNAVTYDEELTVADSALSRAQRSAVAFAQSCESKAAAFEHQADALPLSATPR